MSFMRSKEKTKNNQLLQKNRYFLQNNITTKLDITICLFATKDVINECDKNMKNLFKNEKVQQILEELKLSLNLFNNEQHTSQSKNLEKLDNISSQLLSKA